MKPITLLMLVGVLILVSLTAIPTKADDNVAGTIIYIPIVIVPEKPKFNEHMIDLYYDVNLPIEEYAVWSYLDPSPHVSNL